MLRNFNPTTIDKKIRNEAVKYPEVISITSGKGGVGKSSLSVNLAILLQQTKKKVLLIDADIHLGNLDLILGMRTQYTITDIVKGIVDVEDAILEGPGGIHILPASSAVSDLLEMEEMALRKLSDAFAEYEHNYDIVLLDTGAGISSSVTSFLFGSDKIMVVVTPDPASIADAYAVIKVIRQERESVPILLVTNMTKSQEEGETLYKKMNLMVQKFLNSHVEYGGAILIDDTIRLSVKKQRPFVLDYPNSGSSKGLHLIKRKVLTLPASEASSRKNLFTNFRKNRKISVEVNT